MCSKLTIKTLEQRQQRQRCSRVFVFSFEGISHAVTIFLLLSLKIYMSVWVIASNSLSQWVDSLLL